MATLLATATLEINVTIGDLYVRDDYVALNYVEGGIVAQDLDLATVLSIASGTVTVAGVLAPAVAISSPSISSSITVSAVKKAVGIITAPITATISVSALDLDIAISTIDANVTIDVTARSILLVDPFNTFILQNETRLNTVTAETRSFILQNDSRSFNVKPETRIYNLLKETRNFKIKRPAFVGRVRKDTVNV